MPTIYNNNKTLNTLTKLILLFRIAHYIHPHTFLSTNYKTVFHRFSFGVNNLFSK